MTTEKREIWDIDLNNLINDLIDEAAENAYAENFETVKTILDALIVVREYQENKEGKIQ